MGQTVISQEAIDTMLKPMRKYMNDKGQFIFTKITISKEKILLIASDGMPLFEVKVPVDVDLEAGGTITLDFIEGALGFELRAI